jgi:hypothetical protein
MQSTSEVKEALRLLIWASAATIILWFIPFAEWLTYPIRLFVTFVHEAGHALATVVSTGSVKEIEIYSNGSGVTYTSGGFRLLISSAGYLSTTLYGAALLLLLRRRHHARAAALVTGVLLLIVTVLWGGNFLAWVIGAVIGAGCFALALKGAPKLAHFLMSFLAVQCLLNAFYDLRTLMYLSAFDSSALTDAKNMSEATGSFIPPMLWAFGWSMISLLMLVVTGYVYYRSLQLPAAGGAIQMPNLLSDRMDQVFDKKL